mmetsp:Transcript_17136/g.21635  ORF Transcript_17136/g.21635 Transcript_17136/m.21635 type:complete len:92 (+) Transcript_17136:178-453(+)
MRAKPQINENSKKIIGNSKRASYVNLKVEDRLRLYGIQLNESKQSKAALDAMNRQYESSQTLLTAQPGGVSDSRSMVSSVVQAAKQQRAEF